MGPALTKTLEMPPRFTQFTRYPIFLSFGPKEFTYK